MQGPGRKSEEKKFGMIFQEPMSALNPLMTVGRQLKESIITHKPLKRAEAKKLSLSWLTKVQLEPAIYKRYPHQISGGQKQRVMIAMAMCNHPELLIADEPTTALDVTVQKEIIELMLRLKEEFKTSIIFITHDLELALKISQQIIVMHQGRIVETGSAAELKRNSSEPYTKALLACRPNINNKGKRLPVVADFLENTIKPGIKKNQNTLSTKRIFEAEDLNVWFPVNKNWFGQTTAWFKAVNNINFHIFQGETLGLVGESGCGKSTLSKSIMGLIPLSAGRFFFKGKVYSSGDENEWKKLRRSIQMIFQDPYGSLNPRIKIGDLLSEPLKVHQLEKGNEINKRVLFLLSSVGLPGNAIHKYPHEFSGGQRQRIGIARALALRPELIICDEAVSALDVSIQAQILNLLKDIQEEFQLTYLFISHDLKIVHYFCDRIMVMKQGKILESGSASTIFHHPQNEYTRALINAIPEQY